MSNQELSKKPQPDVAEYNAFFPSPYSLSKFTSPKSDLEGANYPHPYKGKQKILVVLSDERYLPTDKGVLFSTGSHPVETLLPMYHLHKAGFKFDIATLSGRLVKFEHWAMPTKDDVITGFFHQHLKQFHNPHKLSDIVAKLDKQSNYIGVFIPGGHGALIDIPEDKNVAAVLRWAMKNDRYIIAICHGPAAFLAVSVDGKKGKNPFDGYSIVAFPDAIDKQVPDIGYTPGHLTWYFGERLKKMGMTILNAGAKGEVHQDRKILTGDSPFAANQLGKLAATTLLKAIGHK